MSGAPKADPRDEIVEHLSAMRAFADRKSVV